MRYLRFTAIIFIFFLNLGMKFPKGQVFMFIDDSAITMEMINRSTSNSKSDMRINSSTNKRLVEALEPVPDVFKGFQWYSLKQVRIELREVGW